MELARTFKDFGKRIIRDGFLKFLTVMKWTELQKLLNVQNFHSEANRTDQLLIEQKKCRRKHSLSYAGRNNGSTSLGIGICHRCDSAEIFPEYSQNADKFLKSLGFEAKKAA